MSDIHVVPIDDLKPHEQCDRCWCRPRRDDEEPAVVVHNSMDQRETYEQGRALQ